MRAAVYDRPGPAADVLRVETRPDPTPGPGEVLVRVFASGVNPSDVKTRAAWIKTPKDFPRTIPHSDGAGVVEEVGAGVDPARIGERVWLWNAQWGRPDGTAAELCALPARQAVPLPDALSFDEGRVYRHPGPHRLGGGDGGAPDPRSTPAGAGRGRRRAGSSCRGGAGRGRGHRRGVARPGRGRARRWRRACDTAR